MSLFRTALANTARSAAATTSRTFHSSPSTYAVKDTVAKVAHDVNMKVGQGLASAIETGEKATQKTKETIGVAQEKASEASEQASQEVNKKSAQARQAARDYKEDAQRR